MTQTLLTLPTNEIPLGSVDFIAGTVTDKNGNVLDMGVEIAVARADGDDDARTWLPAGWLGTAAAERRCQTSSPVNTALLEGDAVTAGTKYGVYVRLDNTPAHPVVQIGWIVLTD